MDEVTWLEFVEVLLGVRELLQAVVSCLYVKDCLAAMVARANSHLLRVEVSDERIEGSKSRGVNHRWVTKHLFEHGLDVQRVRMGKSRVNDLILWRSTVVIRYRDELGGIGIVSVSGRNVDWSDFVELEWGTMLSVLSVLTNVRNSVTRVVTVDKVRGKAGHICESCEINGGYRPGRKCGNYYVIL